MSALLHDEQGRLVIQLRDDKPNLPFPAHWATLGGAIESDESPDEAMRRELAEEIWPAPPVTFWRRFELISEWKGRRFTVDNHVYVGRLPCPLAEVRLYEGQRLGTFTRAEIETLPAAYGLDVIFKAFFDDYRPDDNL